MQSVLISIRPQWCAKIANGKKTIEVRKTRPKLAVPFKCYIYRCLERSGDIYTTSGKVVGEFVCDKMYGIYYSIYPHDPPVFEEIGTLNRPNVMAETCLSEIELNDYLDGETGYGWHISALKIYDKPRELSEFHKPIMPMGLRYEEDAITRAPQSWCYVEELEEPCKTKN